MSSNYKFYNPQGAYFVSFAIVEWLNVFSNDIYTSILLESLSFCQTKKGMELYAWCIMPNHLHLVFRSIGGQNPEFLLGDFKRFTSQRIVKAISENPEERNKIHYLNTFKNAACKSSNVKHHQFWRHDNHPIEIWSPHVVSQKINYVHNNPVKAGLVSKPEDYNLSSAKDYAGEKGLLDGIVVVK